jgi:hypothetical protein
MQVPVEKPLSLWQEQSAIWEIISGEIVRQHADPIAADIDALVELAADRCGDAADRMREGDRDSAGHALIGCALALGLAARTVSSDHSTIEEYGGEFAAAVSWDSGEPSVGEIAMLAAELELRSSGGPVPRTPSLWELAVRAGACAAGLSMYISRRRGRRDQVSSDA